MFYVCVSRSHRDGHFYARYTSVLRKRLRQHLNSEVRSTMRRGQLKLMYYESRLDDQGPMRGKKYLKSGMGKRYLGNSLKRFLSLAGRAGEW